MKLCFCRKYHVANYGNSKYQIPGIKRKFKYFRADLGVGEKP